MTTRYSWTQPICDDCWDEDHPDKPSPRRGAGHAENCCKCEITTQSGIYIRVDPETVPHPTPVIES
jgi:hypothetical protein